MGTELNGEAVLGCLLGGAIGDALGGVVERGRVCLSDDTQLTLATCQAITLTGRADPDAIAHSMLRWFTERRLSGLGSATLKALRDLKAGAHWALAGAKGEMAAGNGGAMRIAPLAFVREAGRTEIRNVVRITHHSDEAYLGALAVVLILRGLWATSAVELLRAVAAELPDCRVRDQLVTTADAGPGVGLRELAARSGTSGWVVETVPLAIAAAWFMAEASFDAALDELIRLGGDTDTIASIAGQIAGSRLRTGGLPARLVELVPQRALVEDVGQQFLAALRAA